MKNRGSAQLLDQWVPNEVAEPQSQSAKPDNPLPFSSGGRSAIVCITSAIWQARMMPCNAII